jgi:hypothetical protein
VIKLALKICCWPSPAQLFLVSSPTGFMAIFYSLTSLGVFRSVGLNLNTHSPYSFWSWRQRQHIPRNCQQQRADPHDADTQGRS